MALQNCHFPTWALNKLQQNFQCRQHNHNEPNSTDQHNSNTIKGNGTNVNNNNSNNNNKNNNKIIYMVVSYIQGLEDKFKRTLTRKASRYISKGPMPSGIYLWPPRTRTPSYKKVELFTNTNAQPSTVQLST